VIVVGGGVAGLAAAQRLVQAGRKVVLLEARDRFGGRVHTIHDSATNHPVELGAEFIQGNPEELLGIIRKAGLSLQRLTEQHVRASGGRKRDSPEVEDLVARLLEPDGGIADIPVAELLRKKRNEFSREELEAITAYLEGFHAADLERFGSAALAENQAAEEEDSENIFRLAGGYGQLTGQLLSSLDSELAEIRTGVVATRLGWSRGSVEVEARANGETMHARAKQAVIALPLNNLKTARGEEGALLPDPAPEGWVRALEHLEIGAAQHIVLRFEDAWWIQPHRPPPVFVHGSGEPIPVWWTASPPETPFLTGWAGGPKAFRLAGLTMEELVPLALESASRIFGIPVRKLADGLRAAYSHDWTSDPYSRGAYSYGGVGAAEARRLLRQPVADTLVLSGEALAEEGRNATVPGALSSGYRSADRLLSVTA
jgi:monoamine oxidase